MTISKNDNFRQKKYEGYTFCVFIKFGHFFTMPFLMNLNPITPKDHGNTIRV